MNPALLLNPKKFKQQEQKQTSKGKQNGFRDKTSSPLNIERGSNQRAPQFDPLVLLSPSKKRFRDAEATPAAENDKDATNTNTSDALDLIERLHNVGDREHVAFRKRKATNGQDQEDDENNKKAKFSGVGKGGILGDYINDKRKEAGAKAGPPSLSAQNTIDLTSEGDDDVVITSANDKKPEDVMVCLGRLQDAKVNAEFVPIPKARQFQGSSGTWPQMRVTLDRVKDATTIIHVVDAHFRRFGRVAANTALGLAPLLDSRSMNHMWVDAMLAPRKKYPNEVAGAVCSNTYDLIVILYGPKLKAKNFGKYLADKGCRLVDPLPALIKKGYELENPHSPAKPKTSQTMEAMGPNGLTSGVPAPVFAQRTVEEVRSDIQDMFDSLTKTEELPEKETPADVITELLSHQKQALWFLTQREKAQDWDWKEDTDESEGFSLWRIRHANQGKIYFNVITGHESLKRPDPCQGGILGDMMGLGKTLSILSLIMSSRDAAADYSRLSPPRTPQRLLRCNLKATLIVAPLSTLQNWEEQLQQHIRPGALKIYVYHGNKRVATAEEFRKFDVVLTCYSTLAAENRARKSLKPIFDAQWFRVVLDEAHQIRNSTTAQFLACYDLATQRRWAVTGTPVQNRLEDLGALIRFLRIKPFDDPKTFVQYFISAFKAADPEILPKLRLLVDSITLRRTKDRIDLPDRHDAIVKLNFDSEEQKLYDFFLADSLKRVKAVTAAGKLGGRTYAHILKAILRLRQICAHGQELLNEEDLKMTKGLTSSNAIELADEDEERPALTQKQVFEMFYLLRDSDYDRCNVCNKKIGRGAAAAVNEEPDSGEESEDEEKEYIEEQDGGNVQVKREKKKKISEDRDTIGWMIPCYQIICPHCIDDFKASVEDVRYENGYMDCPLCAEYTKVDFFQIKQSELDEDERAKARVRGNTKLAKNLARYHGPHTKTKALLEDLRKFKEDSDADPNDAPIKSVVFSDWTSHLDLIQIALEREGFKYARIDGSMTRSERNRAIETFRDDPEIPIFLASIRAAGLGLNLTTANKVFVMEPQYNPAAEAQAVDRVHRLGQARPVQITRFIMRDSFEEKMLVLQQKKKDLADISMDRKVHLSRVDAAKKRLEDLRTLFK